MLRDSVDDVDDDDFEALKVPQVTKLYSFPGQRADGQTIAIRSEGGYKSGDVDQYFKYVNVDRPIIKEVNVGQENSGDSSRGETTMDICIAGSAAVGATVAVYFSDGHAQGWVDLIKRVTFPEESDPICSILSASYHL